MSRRKKRKTNFLDNASRAVDGIVGVVSPRTAYRRRAFRFAYDAIDGHRTRKKRGTISGTGDKDLTDTALSKLREIARDLGRNNPVAVGLLRTERNGVIGTGPKIEARTEDDGFNKEAEAIWKEEMLDMPCDVKGVSSFGHYIRTAFLSYRRDGDFFTLFYDQGDKLPMLLQAVEGDQVGTPYGTGYDSKEYEVINGMAFDKKTKKWLGCFIGTPNKWGYIQAGSYRIYKAESIQHFWNPDRFSFSRGEPVFAPSIDYLDKLCGYIDAEIVAAKVNACFSMFISRKEGFVEGELPPKYTGGVSSSGEDDDGNRLEHMQPGVVMYGADGESATGIGQVRPGTMFEPFVNRMLTLIGRPLCMPLMLITQDFSGATFMNARIAYQKCQEAWETEQEMVVRPFVARLWRAKVAEWIRRKLLPARVDAFRHEILQNRWPYVDPFKEAAADKLQLANKTTTRTLICARQGYDFKEITGQRAREEQELKELGLIADDKAKKPDMENVARAVRSGVPVGVNEARGVLGLSEKAPKGELLRFNDQDVLQYHIESGILTINEIRRVLGLKSVKWGDNPVRKAGVTVVGDEEEKEEKSESDEKEEK